MINFLNSPGMNDLKMPRTVLVIVLSLSMMLVSCTDPLKEQEARLSGKSLKNIRKITSTYLSHQDDTQEKDDRLVSVVFFNPDQTVDRMYNYTSYPYTSDEPKDQEFLGQPDPAGLMSIMDGLSLEKAENNLLYGNDWPKLLAESYENGNIKENMQGFKKEYRVDYGADQLPDRVFQSWVSATRGVSDYTHGSLFSYENGQLVTLQEGFSGLIGGQAADTAKNHELRVTNTWEMEYDGENLVKLTSGKKSWTFAYKNGQLAESAFYINDKRYNLRKYFYNDQGLKLRTEIFNTNNEPEYTILYDYEYYELAQNL